VGVVVLATSAAGVEEESRAARWKIVDSSSSNRDLASAKVGQGSCCCM
ncbi:hypothetical protein A2U01_0104466, partial [Trifolium medium]|nr:hypothetical protein [Trifolium medium]